MHIRKIVCSESDADSKEEIIGNTNFELRCHETCQPKFLAVPTKAQVRLKHGKGEYHLTIDGY